MREDILTQKEQIKKWIKENKPKAFICKQLHCKPETLNSYLQKMNIEYNGNKGGKGFPNFNRRQPIENYLCKNGKYINSHALKLKLIDFGLKEHKCECCGLSTWLNKPIPIELHHINGDHFDNRLENLQILCPNCHALQDNNSGAANKKEDVYDR